MILVVEITWAISSFVDVYNFYLIDHKPVHPISKEDLNEDEDDETFIFLDRVIVSEDEDDQLLAQSSSREESMKEKRESAAERRVLARLRRRKGHPVWRDLSITLEKKKCQEIRVSDQERFRFYAEIQILKLFFCFNIIKKLADERNFRYLHLKPLFVFRRIQVEDNSLEYPWKYVWSSLYHILTTCPICNSMKSRSIRSCKSESRTKEFAEQIFLYYDYEKMASNPLNFLLSWMILYHI